MADTPIVDPLVALPVPSSIEELSIDALLQRRVDQFKAECDAIGQPELYEFIDLEGEPARILLQESANAEFGLRQRINEVYRSRLLYFANEADLDNVAEDFHGVTRLTDETDDDFKERVRLRNRGSSSAGPDDWWKFHAQSADERVEDVAVTRVPVSEFDQQRGLVRISVLDNSASGIPSQEILDNVTERLTSTAVRGKTATVEVVAASSVVVPVTARVWLYPDAPAGAFELCEPQITERWAATRALGRDVEPSWISSIMQNIVGIKKVVVDAPAASSVVENNQVAVLGTMTITNEGTEF